MEYISDLTGNVSFELCFPGENDGYDIQHFNNNMMQIANKVNTNLVNPYHLIPKKIDGLSLNEGYSFNRATNTLTVDCGLLVHEGCVLMFLITDSIRMTPTNPAIPLKISINDVSYPVYKTDVPLTSASEFYFKDNTIYLSYLEKFFDNSGETTVEAYRWNLIEVSSWKKGTMEPVSWANGTDTELAIMLRSHYQGLIDIHEYWAVGDERDVALTAINTLDSSTTDHDIQERYAAGLVVTFVLMDAQGYDSSAFIVGQKDIIPFPEQINIGHIGMNCSNTNTGGWTECDRRRWLNSAYKNALPYEFRNLFKEFAAYNAVVGSNGIDIAMSFETFSLPSETEVFGETHVSYMGRDFNIHESTAYEGRQFEYYETASNRIKSERNSSFKSTWSLRTHCFDDAISFKTVDGYGEVKTSEAQLYPNLAPFGCI